MAVGVVRTAAISLPDPLRAFRKPYLQLFVWLWQHYSKYTGKKGQVPDPPEREAANTSAAGTEIAQNVSTDS